MKIFIHCTGGDELLLFITLFDFTGNVLGKFHSHIEHIDYCTAQSKAKGFRKTKEIYFSCIAVVDDLNVSMIHANILSLNIKEIS